MVRVKGFNRNDKRNATTGMGGHYGTGICVSCNRMQDTSARW